MGKSHFDVRDKVINKDYVAPEHISPESKDALCKMLRKSPKDRISAKELE